MKRKDRKDKINLSVFRECYSLHFPELQRILPEFVTYAKAIRLCSNKQNFSQVSQEKLMEIVGENADNVIKASKSSCGIVFFVVEYPYHLFILYRARDPWGRWEDDWGGSWYDS